VANGRHVRARLVGALLLNSECGNYLYLQGVLFSPMFNKNITSAPQLMQSQDYTIIMKNDYGQMRYKGTGLKMNLNTTENLYIFIGQRQPEHALKYLALRTTNNSRVLHMTIRKNSDYMINISDLPYLSSLNNYNTVQRSTTRPTGSSVMQVNHDIVLGPSTGLRTNKQLNKHKTRRQIVERIYDMDDDSMVKTDNISESAIYGEISAIHGEISAIQDEISTERKKKTKTKTIDINKAQYNMRHMGEVALHRFLNHHNIKATGKFQNCVKCMMWKHKTSQLIK
jgi:hypothetical protein